MFELKEQQRTEVAQRNRVRLLLVSAAGWRLELFHRAGSAAAAPRDDDTQHHVLGIGHFAISYQTPAEVIRVHDRAIGFGAVSLMAPAAVGGPEVRAYLADPEGVLLELVERRNPSADRSATESPAPPSEQQGSRGEQQL